MEEINWEQAAVEGGIERFRPLIDLPSSEISLGRIVLTPQQSAEIPPGIIDEDEEELLAA